MFLLKYISKFFSSLRTTMWLLAVSLMLLLAGAFIVPGSAEFQSLRSVPLLDWLRDRPLQTTWWLWGLIGVLSVLTASTVFCSVESVIRKSRGTQWLLLISPQVIHIGFLFMLLAHLLSAAGAFHATAAAGEGSLVKISDRATLKVKDINVLLDYYGYISDWKVIIEYLSDGRAVSEDIIKPNSPSVRMGFNINVQDIRPAPHKAVLLQINKDPGAVWALSGGGLFMAGIITLIILKVRMEK